MQWKTSRLILWLCCVQIITVLLITDTLAGTKPLHELPDFIKRGDGKVRYFIHYDTFGNLPDSSFLERLSARVRIMDEVEIRFYPILLFNLTSRRLNLPQSSAYESANAFILFPPPVKDTATVDVGIGSVYMLAPEGSKYILRSTSAPSTFKVNDDVDPNDPIYREVLSGSLPEAEVVAEKTLLPVNIAKEWEGKVFRHVDFKLGTLYLEVYSVAGRTITLETREGPYQVIEQFDGVRVDHYLNAGPSTSISMVARRDEGYYAATIAGADLKAGMHALNLRVDFRVGSFEQRMSPSSYQGILLKGSWDQLSVNTERELPSDFRIRPGICAFNRGQEVRLITNFLFIRNQKSYFSENPEWHDYINPSFGLQIGGTGNQDLVLLLGGSVKASKVGDIVFGFRFGLNPTQTWKGGDNYYFGATIDPELFKMFTKTNQ